MPLENGFSKGFLTSSRLYLQLIFDIFLWKIEIISATVSYFLDIFGEGVDFFWGIMTLCEIFQRRDGHNRLFYGSECKSSGVSWRDPVPVSGYGRSGVEWVRFKLEIFFSYAHTGTGESYKRAASRRVAKKSDNFCTYRVGQDPKVMISILNGHNFFSQN